MAANRDVQDFYELRLGLQGMIAFAEAGQRFLDKHGIALPTKRTHHASNGNGNGNGNGHGLATLRERVKRHYTKRRHAVTPTPAAPAVPKQTHAEKVLAQRRLSATVLEALDRTVPRQPIAEGRKTIGALVRRGYVRKKAGGYVRTAKRYDVGEPAEARPAFNEAPPDAEVLTVAQAAKRLKISDSYVRTLIKQKQLHARSEEMARPGTQKLRSMVVLDRDEVARYQAQQIAPQ